MSLITKIVCDTDHCASTFTEGDSEYIEQCACDAGWGTNEDGHHFCPDCLENIRLVNKLADLETKVEQLVDRATYETNYVAVMTSDLEELDEAAK